MRASLASFTHRTQQIPKAAKAILKKITSISRKQAGRAKHDTVLVLL